MARGAWASARRGIKESRTSGPWRPGFITVLTSPISLAWCSANGTLLYPSWGLAGIAGIFLSLIVYSALFCEAFRWLGIRAARVAMGMAYGSVLVLAASGLYLGFVALSLLRA